MLHISYDSTLHMTVAEHVTLLAHMTCTEYNAMQATQECVQQLGDTSKHTHATLANPVSAITRVNHTELCKLVHA